MDPYPANFDQRNVDDIALPAWMGSPGRARVLKWSGSLLGLPGAWTEVEPTLSLREVWLARITGMHPVFELRREFVGLNRIEASTDGRILAVFNGIPEGLYEFRNFGARRAHGRVASGFFLADHGLGLTLIERGTALEIAEMYAAAREAAKAAAKLLPQAALPARPARGARRSAAGAAAA